MLGLVAIGCLVYVACFVQLGDKSAAGHLKEIWQSEVVQQKVDRARAGVQQELEHRLVDAVTRQGKKAMRSIKKHTEEFVEADREALDKVVASAENP